MHLLDPFGKATDINLYIVLPQLYPVLLRLNLHGNCCTSHGKNKNWADISKTLLTMILLMSNDRMPMVPHVNTWGKRETNG